MKTLSFVIPVYNEAKRLNKTFEALNSLVLDKHLHLSEVIFVNDGSTDSTLRMLKGAKMTSLAPFTKRFPQTKQRIISYSQNKGKGFAITQGMQQTSSDYSLFFDADMSTPLSEIQKFVPFMKKGTEVIIGTRKNGHSTVINHQPLFRELLGKAFTKTAQTVLRVQATDFTCGFKAFSQTAKQAIFTKTAISGWGYDAEILYLTTKYQFSWEEKAVVWSNDVRTKVKLLPAITQTLFDLVRIYWVHELLPVSSQFSKIYSQPRLSFSLPKKIVALFL